MKKSIFGVLFIFLVSLPCFAMSATDLTFMDGRWQGQFNNLVVISHNIVGNQQVFVGRTYMENAAGDNVYVEFTRVDAVNNQLVLTLYPMGEKGVSLVAAAVTATSATFVNPQNAFPSKVIYAIDNNGLLVTHAEGVENGNAKVTEYRQAKIGD